MPHQFQGIGSVTDASMASVVDPSVIISDAEWVAFLQWCLPQMGLRWMGFRRVRRQVCQRIRQRLRSLGLKSLPEYSRHLDRHPDEWRHLDRLCRVTISRFFRDRGVFEALRRYVLPRVALKREQMGSRSLRTWSVGCASGEEPYTLKLLWDLELAHAHPDLRLEIVATDVDDHMLRRAEVARYPQSSLKDLPESWRSVFVDSAHESFLPRPFMEGVEFHRQDVRHASPSGAFSLILCRNMAFTYFSEDVQRMVLRRLLQQLEPAGFLVIGGHERLPSGIPELRSCAFPSVFEKVSPTTRAIFPDAVLRPWRRA